MISHNIHAFSSGWRFWIMFLDIQVQVVIVISGLVVVLVVVIYQG